MCVRASSRCPPSTSSRALSFELGMAQKGQAMMRLLPQSLFCQCKARSNSRRLAWLDAVRSRSSVVCGAIG